MKQTPNLSLKKPELTDVVNIEDLNQNFDTIDTEIKSVKDSADEAFQSASDGKSKIATAITGKGVPTSSSDTFQKMATNINAIETDKTSNDTAVAGDILAPKTAHARGIELTGMMPNNGSVGIKNLTTEGAEYTIPVGYHNGLGKVKAVITGLIASVIKAGTTVGGILGTFTSDATATASQMLSGAIAYVNGNKVIGNMANRGAVTQALAINSSYTIPEGYHNGSGKVTQSIATKGTATIIPGTTDQTIAAGQYLSGAQTIKGDANLISSNIVSGKSIFGLVGTANAKGFATATTPLVIHDQTDYTLTQSSFSYQFFTNGYKLQVSGLTFKPSLILIVGSPGWFSAIYNEKFQGNNIQWWKTGSTYYWSKTTAGTSNFYVVNGGFSLPCEYGLSMAWYAFE
jgi:hypothetical protein